jgi:hypothetical protein
LSHPKHEADCHTLGLAVLEQKLVDIRQRSDHATFRGDGRGTDSFQLRVADELLVATENKDTDEVQRLITRLKHWDPS